MSKFSKTLIIVGLMAFMIVPSLAFAQFSPLVPDCGFDCNFENAWQLFESVIDFLVYIATVFTILMIVWGGAYMIFNFGNESKVTEAKKIITSAVVGLFIVLAAYLIVKFIITVLADPEVVKTDEIFNEE